MHMFPKTINEAVRELRRRTQKSQQVLSTELGLSLSAYQKYEQKQLPEARALGRFMLLAERQHWGDLANLFRGALAQDLAMSLDEDLFVAADSFESAAVSTLLYLIRTGKPPIRTLVEAIADAGSLKGTPDGNKFRKEAAKRGFLREKKQ
jgi:hypothetical protein